MIRTKKSILGLCACSQLKSNIYPHTHTHTHTGIHTGKQQTNKQTKQTSLVRLQEANIIRWVTLEVKHEVINDTDKIELTSKNAQPSQVLQSFRKILRKHSLSATGLNSSKFPPFLLKKKE